MRFMVLDHSVAHMVLNWTYSLIKNLDHANSVTRVTRRFDHCLLALGRGCGLLKSQDHYIAESTGTRVSDSVNKDLSN